MRVKRILVIKIGAIGDVVMALPLIPALQKKYGQLHITWICGKTAAPLVHATQQVDKVIEVEEAKLVQGSFWEKIQELSRVWKQLRGQQMDLVLTLHSDSRYRALSWGVRCSDKRHWGQRGKRYLPIAGRYHANEAVGLLEEGEGPKVSDSEFPSLQLPKVSDRESPSLQLPKSFPKWEKPLVVLAPGGPQNQDKSLRQWPIAHYVALIEKLLSYPAQLAIIGSSDDSWVLSHLHHLPLSFFVGKLTLLECVSLLREASLLITHDSGPLHLAKLVQCQTVALFGPTNPAEFTSPREKIAVLWGGEDLSCRPCYHRKNYAACSDNRCMSEITPSQVLKKVLQLLRWN